MEIRNRQLFLGAIFSLGILATVPVSAFNVLVNSTADAPDANPADNFCLTAANECTLRAAIQYTNQFAGLDAITIPAGTYHLTIPGEGEDLGATGDLDISDDVILIGAGADVTSIDGNGIDKVIHLIGFPNKSVVLTGLHIYGGSTVGGNDGGGVTFDLGQGTIRRCFIESNVAVTGGIFAGTGGGVYNNQATVLIESSTIAFNVAANGGGIGSNGGTTTIIDSTISGNISNSAGGGLYFTGTNILQNVTIAENQAVSGGGIFVQIGNALSTVNSIFAGNTASTSNDCEGTITSAGFNLVQDATGCTGLIGSDLTGVNPNLGALSDQGGTTPTRPLLIPSPAVDAGSNQDCPLEDQRGISRPQGEVCDIGAYEAVYQCEFCDFFSDGILDPNWSYPKPGWSETNSHLVGAATQGKALALAQPAFSGCGVCSIEAVLQTEGGQFNKVWLLGWYLDKKNHIEVVMSEGGDKFIMKQRLNGALVARAKALMQIDPNVPYTLKVVFDGVNFTLLVNGNNVASMLAGGSPSGIGTVGFQVKNTIARFDSIIVIAP